ncbi:probable G-protein coupled receptor 139 [Hemiscyllium ocellatum]|uniref:probable G-protein coupled receptor 139 n=1 Tax=Hemiscyllium ocellatum TaxID=170820 RepID=UPI002966F295|nr:probable G-protein coupled receptor 139 [Hemiscyllium ocellatum]
MHGAANSPVFAICYCVLGVLGVPANLLAIIILSRGRCGLSRCITFYLVAIAVNDFLVIVIAVILNRIGGTYFRFSLLSTTPGCTVTSMLAYTTRDASVWLTVAFTIDRFVAICWQSLKTRYCTEKNAALIIGIICALSCVKNVPYFFIHEPLYILDGVPWFCGIKDSYYVLRIWQVYDWMDHILTPFLPFFLILLLNIFTVKHIISASRARKRLRGTENREDQEMANRRKSIILLFAISLSFLLLWVTYIGRFLHVRITGEGYFTGLDFNDPRYILQEMTNLLQLVSSCNNVFIYAVSQNKFREEVQKLMLFPYTRMASCLKK